MTAAELRQEALSRAVNGRPNANYAAILEGFSARGIPFDDIRPRENVFTFNAWRALGRHVRKGEHGIKVLTFITVDASTGIDRNGQETRETYRRPKTTTVFHVSQTDPDERGNA